MTCTGFMFPPCMVALTSPSDTVSGDLVTGDAVTVTSNICHLSLHHLPQHHLSPCQLSRAQSETIHRQTIVVYGACTPLLNDVKRKAIPYPLIYIKSSPQFTFHYNRCMLVALGKNILHTLTSIFFIWGKNIAHLSYSAVVATCRSLLCLKTLWLWYW